MPPISLPSFSINLSLPLRHKQRKSSDRIRCEGGGHLSPLRTLETSRVHTQDFVSASLGRRDELRPDESPERRWPQLHFPGLGFDGGEGKTRSPAAGTNGLAASCQQIRFFRRQRTAAEYENAMRLRSPSLFLAARLGTHPETKLLKLKLLSSAYKYRQPSRLGWLHDACISCRRLCEIQKYCWSDTNGNVPSSPIQAAQFHKLYGFSTWSMKSWEILRNEKIRKLKTAQSCWRCRFTPDSFSTLSWKPHLSACDIAHHVLEQVRNTLHCHCVKCVCVVCVCALDSVCVCGYSAKVIQLLITEDSLRSNNFVWINY